MRCSEQVHLLGLACTLFLYSRSQNIRPFPLCIKDLRKISYNSAPNIILNKTERHGVTVTLLTLIRLLSVTLIIIAEGFRGCPQLLQENTGIVPRLDYGTFLCNCEFASRRATDARYSERLTASKNQPH
jgi:hypothetical protein